MKLNSHNGFLLVRPPEAKDVIVSGIIIPTDGAANDEQIANGIVVVGNETYPEGSVVYFNKLIPADIHLEENGKREQFFALQASDVMFSEMK